MMLLLAACVDHHADKGSHGESATLDSGELDSGDADSGDTGGADTGDTGVYEPLPLSEVELQRWSLRFFGEWGNGPMLRGTNPDGDVVMLAGPDNREGWEVGTTYTSEFSDDLTLATAFGTVYQGPGLDCWIEECFCTVGTPTYRVASGQLDVSVWRYAIDIRFTDLVLRPNFEAEDLVVPLIEITGVPIEVCPRKCD